MKIAVVLSIIFARAAAFGVAPSATIRPSTGLAAMVSEEDMTADQLEIYKISQKWSEVRQMSREEADQLDPEWKEAYDRFYTKYDADMERMTEIAGKLKNMIEPPRVAKKTKGQRKRDKYAKVQAREAAREAARAAKE